MAIEIKEFNPFQVGTYGSIMCIVCAYPTFSIDIDGEMFHFIPNEGKVILVDTRSKKVINSMDDVFVFRRGNHYKRIPVHQLSLFKGFNAQICKLIASATGERQQNPKGVEPMKQKVKIIRKVDIERQYRQMLTLEQDYELASLSQAMKDNDNAEIIRSKKRLKEIHNELEDIAVYG